MEKIKLPIKKLNNLSKKYKELVYKINPYITLQEKSEILEEIYLIYQKRMEEKEHLISLVAGIIADLDFIIVRDKTNIDLVDVSYDDLVCSGILETVKSSIVNYKDIRDSVEYMIWLYRIPDISSFNFNDVIKDLSKEQIDQITMIVKKQVEENGVHN